MRLHFLSSLLTLALLASCSRTARNLEATARFSEDLHFALRSGAPLIGTLAAMAESDEPLPPVADLLQQVRAGRPLADAASAHPDFFDPACVALLRCFDAFPSLGDVALTSLAELAELTKERVGVNRELSRLLPARWASMVSAALVMGTLGWVLCARRRVTWNVRDRLGVSVWTLAAGAAAFQVIDRAFTREIASEFHDALVFAEFGRMLGSGVPILGSLSITADAVKDEASRRCLRTVIEDVRQGGDLRGLKRSFGLRGRSLVMGVGEATGNFDRAVQLVAAQLKEKARARTSYATTVLWWISLAGGTLSASILALRRWVARPHTAVFVSFRQSECGTQAALLCDRLRERLRPRRVFNFEQDMQGGDHISAQVRRAIEKADVVLLLIGTEFEHTVSAHGKPRIHELGDILRQEIELALDLDKHIVPVLVRRDAMPDAESLPETIRGIVGLNALLLRDGRDRDADMRDIVAAVAAPRRVSPERAMARTSP